MNNQIRISGAIRRRAMTLLHMEYTPSELAEDLNIKKRDIYERYIPAGMPHRRDDHNRIWVVGIDFREWIDNMQKQKQQRSTRNLKDNEAFCLSCRKRVTFADGAEHVRNNHRLALVGECSDCHGRIRRFISERR